MFKNCVYFQFVINLILFTQNLVGYVAKPFRNLFSFQTRPPIFMRVASLLKSIFKLFCVNIFDARNILKFFRYPYKKSKFFFWSI